MKGTLGDQTPEIEYPCAWSYRLIGDSEPNMRGVVGRILGESEYELVVSRESRTGKYVSLKLTVVVQNDVQRLMLYRRLSQDPVVRYVL
ncbi:MAG: HP0495 family protein [Planctomycetota bacterium]